MEQNNKSPIPSFICKEGDKNYISYADTDSIYVYAHPFLQSLYPNFDDMEEDDKEDLLENVALKYQGLITKHYDTLAQDIFNIKDTHYFEMKTEAVISSAYFRAPRRYSQWIKRKEGIKVDELDIKGLEFKKTNFPQIFSVFVEGIMEQALKGVSENLIAQQVLEYKQRILNKEFNFVQLGNPTAVKTLNNYLDSPPLNGLLFSTLKIRASAAVKASWRYNDLITYWGLHKKHSVISQGDKVKWVYLKPNPYQIDTIAFLDFDIPDKISEFIEEFIDYEKVFESVLLNKLQGLFDDLGFRLILNPYEHVFFEF